jgi:hypothetical protein
VTTLVNTILDMGGARRITNLGDATAASEPVTLQQMQAAIEGIAWKDSVRVASTANLTLNSPGASIDGISLSANDRVLVKNQSNQFENGIYIWNGAAVPMSRALDSSTFAELEGAVVNVEEGTNGGTQWRQTQVNGSIGANNIIWTAFGTSAPVASESTAGIAEIATQAETDGGTDDTRFVTPLKLATYSGRAKRFSQTIGDAAATSIVVTHNLGTEDVVVSVRETGGSKREVITEIQHTSTNSVTLVFDSAPALNAYRVTVVG